MRSLFFLCFFLLFSTFSAQFLKGRWILDRITLENGENLPINDPSYSFFAVYEIDDHYILFNTSAFTLPQKIKFSNDADVIKTEVTSYKYEFRNEYLILQEVGDTEKRKYWLLKVNDFVKKFPEFDFVKTIRNGREAYIGNDVLFPKLSSKESFMPLSFLYSMVDSIKFEELSFSADFILTTNNKIKDVRILDSMGKKFDQKFIDLINKSEGYFLNNFGKDIIVVYSEEYQPREEERKDRNIKKLYESYEKIKNYYRSNRFVDVTNEYLNNLELFNNNNVTIITKEIKKIAGISFLAQNNTEKACECFLQAGKITDFKVRNYLLDFCKKRY